VDHDDKEHAALNKFGQLWKDKFAADSLLVFSTGRSHALYEELRVSAA
jgi:sucrose-6-phosphatase